jgi:2-polyprenyl-3-methyl-5-hydroxy-6-metoxy-1,4-benzoquinol methylase
MFGSRREFPYRFCKDCQSVFIEDIPENLHEFYPDQYYAFRKINLDAEQEQILSRRQIKQLKNLLYGNWFIKNLRFYSSNLARFRFLKKLIISQDTSILDIGAGNGESFLIPIYLAGHRNLYGVDPYLDENIYYNKFLRIDKTFLADIIGKWDLIVVNHAFEHMESPLTELKRIRELINENGTCIIRTPTTSSYCWKKYREHWYQLDPPRHIFIPSIKSISYLAGEAGFKLADILYDSTSHQFWISEFYRRNISMKEINENDLNPLMGLKIIYRLMTWFLNKTGRGDQAAFYLKKT